MNPLLQKIVVVDSHTGGEPTRVVIAGGPELGRGSVAERLELLRNDHDDFRRAVVNEPRGSDVLVGALLLEPHDPSCDFGVVYFDNVKFIGMCGHGTIGLVVTLAHLGKLTIGKYRIETPVGIVGVELIEDNLVSIDNVPSYRKVKDFPLEVPGVGTVLGDVAWGGNWFFLTDSHSQLLASNRIENLTDFAWKIRTAVNAQGFPEVDHIVLLQPIDDGSGDYKNFVLCPGKAYDRSPCGTGTSARLACLAADGKLNEGTTIQLESIIGSRFSGSFRWHDETNRIILPTIQGRAYIAGETTLLFDPNDPFRYGIAM